MPKNKSRVDGERRAAGPTGSTASGIWAVRAFLQRVPDWMPSPEVFVEEDGMICFDWDVLRRRTMSVSIDDNGHIAWSALIGDYTAHGAGTIDPWPEPLSEAFTRFDEATKGDTSSGAGQQSSSDTPRATDPNTHGWPEGKL